jgi:GNAT superfamily N-acetyltransferase
MLRKLKQEDQAAFVDLRYIAFERRTAYRVYDELNDQAFVWEEDGQLRGFCKWIEAGFMRKYAEIGTLMVDPAYRGRGIAKALVAATVAEALNHFDNVKIYDTSRYGQTSKIAKSLGFIEKDAREWWYK